MTEGGAAELGLSNVGGVFVVLIGGLTLACVMVFFEVLWDKRQQRRAALLVRKEQVRSLFKSFFFGSKLRNLQLTQFYGHVML